MKKRLFVLLLSVILLISVIPVPTSYAVEHESDPDEDGEYFVLKASDTTVSKDATTVDVDINILENTGVYSMKYYVIYDKELSLVSNDNVTAGSAFPDFLTSDVGSKDKTAQWMSANDPDWDWMLSEGFLDYNENFYTGFDLGIEDFNDVRITTVFSCCARGDSYSTDVGTVCTLSFRIVPDNTKDQFTVRILPVHGNYIRYEPDHPLADSTGVVEFLDPIGLPGTVTVEGSDDPKATFTVSEATITEGDETAKFTLSLANNPGIFGFAGYIGYNEKMSLSSFDIGTVFAENEFPLGNPLDIGSYDRPASGNKMIRSVFAEYNASTDGVLTTSVYIEANSISVNNTNNGVIASFSLNTSDLPAGEYDILFYMHRESVCNVDFETVEFKIVHGKLTVKECTHETVKGATAEPDCLNEGYTEYYCPICDRTHKRDIVPKAGHSNTAVVTKPTCTTKGYTTYTCNVCGEVSTGDETRATGHDLKSETVKEPTYDEKGSVRTYCTQCEYEVLEDVPKLDHSSGNPPLSPPPLADGDGVLDEEESDDTFTEDSSDVVLTPDYDFGASAPDAEDDRDPTSEGVLAEPETQPSKEEKTEPQNTNKTENKSHQTGDGMTIAVIFLICSVAGAAAVVLKRKKLFVK